MYSRGPHIDVTDLELFTIVGIRESCHASLKRLCRQRRDHHLLAQQFEYRDSAAIGLRLTHRPTMSDSCRRQ